MSATSGLNSSQIAAVSPAAFPQTSNTFFIYAFPYLNEIRTSATSGAVDPGRLKRPSRRPPRRSVFDRVVLFDKFDKTTGFFDGFHYGVAIATTPKPIIVRRRFVKRPNSFGACMNPAFNAFDPPLAIFESRFVDEAIGVVKRFQVSADFERFPLVLREIFGKVHLKPSANCYTVQHLRLKNIPSDNRTASETPPGFLPTTLETKAYSVFFPNGHSGGSASSPSRNARASR